MYHQISEREEESSLIKFGYSKDRRPDLKQYRQMLATLDPSGLPLLGATLAGNGTDESDYLPTWRKMTTIIAHQDFLYENIEATIVAPFSAQGDLFTVFSSTCLTPSPICFKFTSIC